MTKILAFIKAHAAPFVAFAIAATLFVLWQREHDARNAADAKVQAAQSAITDLKSQQTAVAKAAKTRIVYLQKEAEATDTPAKAVAVLTDPTPTETDIAEGLDAAAIPDAPTKVAVDALPLYQTLNSCKQDAVNLAACSQTLDLQKQIDVQKDDEITALKKKPSFLSRVVKVAKVTACAGVGGAAGGYIKGGVGAAVGAAAGAAVCQLF